MMSNSGMGGGGYGNQRSPMGFFPQRMRRFPMGGRGNFMNQFGNMPMFPQMPRPMPGPMPGPVAGPMPGPMPNPQQSIPRPMQPPAAPQGIEQMLSQYTPKQVMQQFMQPFFPSQNMRDMPQDGILSGNMNPMLSLMGRRG